MVTVGRHGVLVFEIREDEGVKRLGSLVSQKVGASGHTWAPLILLFAVELVQLGSIRYHPSSLTFHCSLNTRLAVV